MVDLSGNDCWNDQLEYHDGIGELCLCNSSYARFMNYDTRACPLFSRNGCTVYLIEGVISHRIWVDLTHVNRF